ncbi:MAG: C39 family peptidase [Streptococcaceae bacterium]|nr:C39 family peptidase [Streptococcaceae bacterium]
MRFKKKFFLLFSFFVSLIVGISAQAEVENLKSGSALDSISIIAARGLDYALPGSYPVYYSQFDPSYASKTIGGYAFGETGCIPTTIAMVFESYGVSGNPFDWGVRLHDVGEFNSNGGGATTKAIKVAGDMVGLQVLPLRTKDEIDATLSNSIPIIFCGGNQISNSSDYGHAVVLYGLNNNGQTFVTDPSRNAMTGWHSTAFLWDNRISSKGVSFFGIAGSTLPQASVRFLPVFRVYDPNGDRHLFTTNSNERDDLIRRGWRDEGIAFQVLTWGVPIYRVYDASSGEHLYTANLYERDDLVAKGWHDESIAFYVSNLGTEQEGGDPIYRICNERGNQEHMFTTNYNEVVKATEELGWRDEGTLGKVN